MSSPSSANYIGLMIPTNPASMNGIQPTPAISTSTRKEAKALLAEGVTRLYRLPKRLRAYR